MDTIGIQRGGRGRPPISTWPGLCPAQTISGSGMVASILRRAVQDLMGPECVPSGQQQPVLLEDAQAIQQHAHVASRQPVQAHCRGAGISSFSHARRACGPSSRRNCGHILTSDSECRNRSRSSRWASASSSA